MVDGWSTSSDEFDEDTKNAVIAFQEDSKLWPDGVAGEDTQRLIASALSDKALSGELISGSIAESIKPYEHLGVSFNEELGVMEFEGYLVREIVDVKAGVIITRSLGTGFPEGSSFDDAIDLTVVYENGEIVELRKSTNEEYQQRTEERLAR